MIGALALLLAALVAWPACAFDPFAEAGIEQRPGAALPVDLAFRDETDATVTLRELGGGKPIVLVPVLHRCPNICGVTLSGLAQAIRAQRFRPGRDFTVVSFSIDAREGPADAQAALDELQSTFPKLRGDGVHALTGTAETIAAVTDALGYRFAWDEEIGQYAHIAAVAVLTPDGRLARWLYGIAPDPTDLTLALTEAGEGRVGSWREQLLLLCYHYDPQTGRYGSLVTGLLRIGGGITVGLGAGLIGIALLRERRTARKGGR